jgi:hypothetical protein
MLNQYFKNAGIEYLKKYRGIRLLNVDCKISARIMKIKLTKYYTIKLENNKIGSV